MLLPIETVLSRIAGVKVERCRGTYVVRTKTSSCVCAKVYQVGKMFIYENLLAEFARQPIEVVLSPRACCDHASCQEDSSPKLSIKPKD
jgi:hypothetical protein